LHCQFLLTAGYDNLFVGDMNDVGSIPNEDVLRGVQRLIDVVDAEIREREKDRRKESKLRLRKKQYLTYVYEYIQKFEQYNLVFIHEYIANTYGWTVMQLVYQGRMNFGIEGNFSSGKNNTNLNYKRYGNSN